MQPPEPLAGGDGIDVEAEELLTFQQAATHPALRRDSRTPCALSKVYRLTGVGLNGVTLESVRLARRLSHEQGSHHPIR